MRRPMGRITALLGDITTQRVDAVVNAANERLLGGGGVDGAIHRAAGPELLAACRAIPEVRPGVRCPTGEARITPAFRLPASWIVHTVGPVYRGAREDPELLARAHRSAFELAARYGARSLAVPAISCGVYGYPAERAAPIAVAVATECESVEEIRFVLFSPELLAVWERAIAAAQEGRSQE